MNHPSHKDVVKYRNTAQYRRLRARMFARDPLCVKCKAQGLTVEAREMDHIIPIFRRWDLRWDESNLQMLCKACHAKKSEEEMNEKYAGVRGPLWDKFQAKLQDMIQEQTNENR